TSGIAAILIVQQLRDALGLQLTTAPPQFIERLSLYATHLETLNPHAAAISIGTLLILGLWPRVRPRGPAPFVALILATLLVQLLDLPVETIGTRFGQIHAGFPQLSLPSVSLEHGRALVMPALAIAALG